MSGTLLYTHHGGGDGRCFSVGQRARAGREWGVGKCKLLNSHTVCVRKFVFIARDCQELHLRR